MYVSLTHAKRHLEKLIDRALMGEEIVICRRGKPMVRLEPISAKAKNKSVRRVPGRLQGKISDWKGMFKLGSYSGEIAGEEFLPFTPPFSPPSANS